MSSLEIVYRNPNGEVAFSVLEKFKSELRWEIKALWKGGFVFYKLGPTGTPIASYHFSKSRDCFGIDIDPEILQESKASDLYKLSLLAAIIASIFSTYLLIRGSYKRGGIVVCLALMLRKICLDQIKIRREALIKIVNEVVAFYCKYQNHFICRDNVDGVSSFKVDVKVLRLRCVSDK